MITTIINATQDNQLQANADYVINWFGWSENDNTLSVMQKIEKNKDHYKKIYLDLVHQVGHKKNIKTNNNIINEMRITSEFSFWWMSLTSEKSPFRSNAVLNCIKLIALEDILNEKKITLAEIRTDDKIILNSIENLCSDMGIKENKTNKKIKIDPRSLFFVHQIKGLVYFARHIMTRLFFKTLDAPKWDSNIEKNLFIFSNFYNLDQPNLSHSKIKYKQWGELPEKLSQTDIKTHFFNHYIRSPQISSEKIAYNLLKNNQDTKSNHAIVDQYLDISMIITAFKIWIRLNARFFKLKTESDLFSIKYRKSDLEKIMKPDWLSSWVGTAAVANIFWHLIFEKITKKITKNSVGLFLSENQGWERALIYAYKKNVGTKIIAVPHSTVRYWDLRYSQSDLDLGLNQKDQTPNPDCYAMNGDQALSEFLNNKINNIKKVEALRYQYLLDLNKNYTEIKEQNCLLLLGDYSLERTLKMLSLITDVVISNNLKLVYKPHPFCADVRSHINPQINYAIDNRDFSQLSEKYGMAFVSNTSSVALDAYLAGLQVFVFLDDSDFNMSPLKDIAEVRFVASKEDFKDWTNQKNMHIVSRENTFFFLDKELALWSRLLKDYGLNL